MSYLKSTILSKWVMAITGVVLVGFLIGHTAGNLQVFLGPHAYNSYAAFLQSLGEILWGVRIFLALCIVLHIITSIKLKVNNSAAKPVAYQYKSYLKAKLTSRTMIWTGIMIFAFLVYHLLHFTAGTVHKEYYNYHEPVVNEKSTIAQSTHGQEIPPQYKQMVKSVKQNGETYVIAEDVKTGEMRHDVYKMVVMSFKNPLISIIYIIAVVILGFHLNHAIQSMFQTLGLNHPKYWNLLQNFSVVLSILIVVGMVAVPISILSGIVGGAV